MKLKRRKDGWWILGVPPFQCDGETCTENGPYETRKEASEIRDGLARTIDKMDRYEAAWLAVLKIIMQHKIDVEMKRDGEVVNVTTLTRCRLSLFPKMSHGIPVKVVRGSKAA